MSDNVMCHDERLRSSGWTESYLYDLLHKGTKTGKLICDVHS